MAFVYLHVFPNGKVYVGMTNRTPEIRWENGNGYRTQPLMSKAINKYGWDNVRHEIIASGVSLDEANRIEKDVITANMSTDFRFYHFRIRYINQATKRPKKNPNFNPF